MAILVTCECGKQFQTGDECTGRRARCPNCGREMIIPGADPTPYSNPYAVPKASLSGNPDFATAGYVEPRTSGKAIASLILGLTSFLCVLFTGIPAIIFGALGLGDIKGSQGRVMGKGMAITGIVLGSISCTIGTLAVLLALLLPAVQAAREAARRMQCANNLRQVGLAMHNYHTMYGHLPTAAITDPQGQPLLSWRVTILPLMNKQSLYNKFKLDETWDSPHNQALLAEMPNIYHCPSDPPAVDQTTTRYQVLTGPGTLFEGEKGTQVREITDGTSNTLLVVEATRPVPWTKPEDLPAGPGQAIPAFGSIHPGGFQALFADGAVRFLKKTITPQALHALTTKDGGEIIGPGEL